VAGGLTEHPVLIPTSHGPVGGIVCEPVAPPQAALILLHTGGRSGRSGFSSEWALLSRRLAELGTTVLRYDYCKEGDSSTIAAGDDRVDAEISAKLATDLALLDEVVAWFRQRTRGLDLIVVGICYGGRLGLELAAKLRAVKSTMLVVPFLRPVDEDNRERWRERMLRVRRGETVDEVDGSANPRERLDPLVVDAFERALASGPAWVLIGERDADEAVALGRTLGDRGLEVEVEPGAALYPGNDPGIQELVSDRVAARLRQVLERSATTPLGR
jgi:dienelactone hydrolase